MNPRRYRLLTLLVSIALLATGCGFAGIGSESGYTIQAEFSRTFNLFPGSRVRIVGVDVGKVEELSVEEGAEVVTATLRLRDGVQVPTDVAAVIVPEALIGERYIQLAPAFTGGEALEPGHTILRERTSIPAEWDEVLHTVNDLVTTLDGDEVARLVVNLSEVLGGRGEKLGQVLEQANEAIDSLENSDDEFVALASRLSDLNETLNSRDRALGELIDDWDTVITAIAEQRGDLDTALGGLARFTQNLADLLARHDDNLEADIATLTRVGRTAVRNLDEFERSIHGQADLFQFAFESFDFDHNWMPLVNHTDDLGEVIADRVTDRLVGLCLRLEIEECSDPAFWEEFTGELDMCLPPLVACPEESSAATSTPDGDQPDPEPVGELLDRVIDQVPGLREQLEAERSQTP